MPPDDPSAALVTSHAELPQRLRDVIYGKLRERSEILQMLDAMSVQSAARMATAPNFLAQLNGAPSPARDPVIDHILGLIAGCAHVPEDHRAVAPASAGIVALVGVSPEERDHFR